VLGGLAQTDKQQKEFEKQSVAVGTAGRLASRLRSGESAEVRVSRAPRDRDVADNAEYYDRITDWLMGHLRPYVGARVVVLLESYAFNQHSISVTMLAELGGVIRNKLHRAGLYHAEVSPTSIKKAFTGSGTADKPQMWRRFCELAPELKLDKWLPSALSETNIPSPHQDIVDAFASAWSAHSRHPLRPPVLHPHPPHAARRSTGTTPPRPDPKPTVGSEPVAGSSASSESPDSSDSDDSDGDGETSENKSKPSGIQTRGRGGGRDRPNKSARGGRAAKRQRTG
jgi:Holliday junction resolvasome RuvABC endonuclease subunit